MKTIDVPEDLVKNIGKWKEDAEAIQTGLNHFALRKMFHDKMLWAMINKALPETEGYFLRYDHEINQITILRKKKDLNKDDL